MQNSFPEHAPSSRGCGGSEVPCHEAASVLHCSIGHVSLRATKTLALISFLEGSKAESPFCLLVFRRKDGEGGEVAVRATWSGSTPPSPERFSATVRELNASAQVSQVASDVLKGSMSVGRTWTL